MRTLADVLGLLKKQRDDVYIGQVKEAMIDPLQGKRGVSSKDYFADETDLVWYRPGGAKPRLAISLCMVVDLLTLVNSQQGISGYTPLLVC